jgi:hypothetical protein
MKPGDSHGELARKINDLRTSHGFTQLHTTVYFSLAQGMAECFGVPVVTAACFFCCRRAMGAVERPALPASSLVFQGGAIDLSLGHFLPRERGAMPP